MNKEELSDFVLWAQANITGDEKGQAQIFLDHLFRAIGYPGGSLSVDGGTPEYRIRKDVESGGGTAFADFVWKPYVLIEMKKRSASLQKCYRQAFDYWTRLVPNRPRYVILCNFDEFHVYDFEIQMDAPVDTIALHELPVRYDALAFLAPGNPSPVFKNDCVAVTRKAADHLAACFNHMIIRKVDRRLAQSFTLQMLVAFFSEDIGLLEKSFVTRLLDDCTNPAQSYDLIGGLFRAMNTNPPETGGRYKGVPYFNGGLFSNPACIELDIIELNHLREAAREDWSKVQPEIFGTLFQHSMDTEERHAFGAHFTHPNDIMKIIGPTIVEPWLEQIEGAKTLKRLHELEARLHNYRVLDPACGSGNFLYIAYREIKRIEVRLYERIDEYKKNIALPGERRISYVSSQNFFGIDMLPFAVEIAKVTMMIARKLAIDEMNITENALPLDNLDSNFIVADALLSPEGQPTVWPKVDVIIGNPPFLGAKRLKPEYGSDYVNKLRRAYPEIPGMADYCVYWFRKANDHLPACTAADPLAGRAGLVGTQNIRNNQSRVAGLDSIAKTGTIIEAVDNQPWSGEANVHVSIANWVKTRNPALLPKTRKLWYKVTPTKSVTRRKRGQGSAGKEYEITFRECPVINSALSDKIDVSQRRVLLCNKNPKRCFQGKIPGYEGFLLPRDQAKAMEVCEPVVPYLTGREILGDISFERYAIDFQGMDMAEAAKHKVAFTYCRDNVLPAVQKAYDDAFRSESDMRSARQEHLNRWWQFWNRRDELNRALKGLGRYIGCSRVGRRPIMVFLSSKICPSDLIQVFAFDDDYSFGILQSAVHFEWLQTSSRMKVESDVRYSVRAVFETFPWPQFPNREQVMAVADAGRNIRRIRAELMQGSDGGLRAIYRVLELPGKHPLKDAHAKLDSTVTAAFGFDNRSPVLNQLLALNTLVAEAEDAGTPVCSPGVPESITKPEELITEDCITP